MHHRSAARRGALGALVVVMVLLAAPLPASASAPAVTAAQVPPSCGPPPPSLTPSAPARGGFVPTAPVRLLDTRDGTGTSAPGLVGAGCTAVVDLTASPVPAGASAVALSVTATEAVERGYVTVYPCGAAVPYASNLNPRVGDPTPNLVIVPVDPVTRRVCLFTFAATHLVVDLTGWFVAGGGRIHPFTPARLLDTRTPLQPPGTVPLLAGARPGPGTVVELPVAGVGIVPANAAAVAVNVTVDQTAAAGFVTVFPCGSPPPLASNVNYRAADTRATQALVGLGAGGRLCLFTFAGAHLVVDVSAWFEAPGSAPVPAALPSYGTLTPVVAERLVDTRDGTGGLSGAFGAGEQRVWQPLATGRVPANATALVVNVTATEAAAPGFVRLSPCDDPAPTVSTVNVVPGIDATNVAIVPLPANGQVCAFSYAGTHVLIDLLGAFTLPAPFADLAVAADGLAPAPAAGVDDYAFRCTAGPNVVPVSVVPAPGVAVAIAVRTPEGAVEPGPAAVFGPVARSVVATPDDAVVVILSPRAGPVTELWFRCLPPDFPTLEVAVNTTPDPGWYLLDSGIPVSLAPTASPFAIVLDEHAVPVWYRRVSPPVIDVHRRADGRLVWGEFSAPGFGTDPTSAYEVRDLDGTLVEEWFTVGSPTGYHDTVELPNGDRLLTTYRIRPGTVDLRGLGPGYGASERVVDSAVQRIRPNGTLVWEWWTQDHIDDLESTAPTRFGFCSCVDLVHINALDVTPAGDIVVSARNIDGVLVVRDPGVPGGGSIIAQYGGIESTVTFDDPPYGGFARQHDAQLLPNGNLLLFDDRTPSDIPPPVTGRPRGVEYRIDGTVLTRVAQREYPVGGAISFGLGSTRRLPDGGWVINWGGLDRPAFGEYDVFGVQRFEVTMTGGRLPYRVVKEPADAFDQAALRATAGRGP